MLKLRLSMGGTKKRPVYKIVVADSKFPRDGKFIEKLGFFNPLLPKEKKERIGLQTDRIKYWLSQGAQPTTRVARILGEQELIKMPANVVKKIDEKAPNEIVLVLDATSGQNILNQVEEFNKIIPLTGLIMTKLDGTAKGGILLALTKKYKIPIIGLGLGEKEDDLQIFDVEKFADAFTQIN